MSPLAESWQVLCPGMWENSTGPLEWYAVCNDNGIIAYFRDETDADAWREQQINNGRDAEI